MSRDPGFHRADIDTGMLDDPKFRRLWRTLSSDNAELWSAEREMALAAVTYLATVLQSWADGDRPTAEGSLPLWLRADEATLKHLVDVGLLDEDHRIPKGVINDWIGPAERRRQGLVDAGRLGGLTTQARARLKQSSEQGLEQSSSHEQAYTGQAGQDGSGQDGSLSSENEYVVLERVLGGRLPQGANAVALFDLFDGLVAASGREATEAAVIKAHDEGLTMPFDIVKRAGAILAIETRTKLNQQDRERSEAIQRQDAEEQAQIRQAISEMSPEEKHRLEVYHRVLKAWRAGGSRGRIPDGPVEELEAWLAEQEPAA